MGERSIVLARWRRTRATSASAAYTARTVPTATSASAAIAGRVARATPSRATTAKAARSMAATSSRVSVSAAFMRLLRHHQYPDGNLPPASNGARCETYSTKFDPIATTLFHTPRRAALHPTSSATTRQGSHRGTPARHVSRTRRAIAAPIETAAGECGPFRTRHCCHPLSVRCFSCYPCHALPNGAPSGDASARECGVAHRDMDEQARRGVIPRHDILASCLSLVRVVSRVASPKSTRPLCESVRGSWV